MKGILSTPVPSGWPTQSCPANGLQVKASPWDNSLLFTVCSTTHKSGTSGERDPPYQQRTNKIIQQLPKTSVFWAHKTITWSPGRRLLQSWYSRIMFSYCPTEVLKVAFTSASEKAQPPLLTTYSKPAALHSTHLLRTLTGIHRFYRERLCKKSVASKPLQ